MSDYSDGSVVIHEKNKRIEHLESERDAALKELADVRHHLAATGDAINQELRENGPAEVGQYIRDEDIKNGVRMLVSVMHRKYAKALSECRERFQQSDSLFRERISALESELQEAKKPAKSHDIEKFFEPEKCKHGNEIPDKYSSIPRCYNCLLDERDEATAALAEKQEALEAVTPRYEKYMMAIPTENDIGILQLCVKALSTPAAVLASEFVKKIREPLEAENKRLREAFDLLVRDSREAFTRFIAAEKSIVRGRTDTIKLKASLYQRAMGILDIASTPIKYKANGLSPADGKEEKA